MRKFSYGFVGAALAALAVSPAMAQSQPSAKVSAVQSSGTVVSGSEVTKRVMMTTIKAPNAKELAIDLSLQCGLYTFTKVKSQGGKEDKSSAGAKVIGKIKVLDSDGNEVAVYPSSAVFCERQQAMTAKFGGVIDNLAACTGPAASEDCQLSDEEVSLALKTMSANAYNFFVLNLPGSDVYTVEAWVTVDSCVNGVVNDDFENDPFFGTCSDGDDPDANAKAFVGGASMFVDEVRFAN